MTTPKEDKWSKLLNLMPSRVAEVAASKVMAPESLDEGQYNYRRAISVIPGSLHERLADPEDELRVEVGSQPAWCLCEVPEGDYPRIRVFSDLELLARHMAKLEGEEVCVWAFYGTPLRLTQQDSTGRRYLQISGQDLVRLPSPGEELTIVPHNADMLFQEDGRLGDASFTEGQSDTYYAYQPPKDDDFDPEDDDEDITEVDV